MWIVLLDHSGSMGDPFAADLSSFSGRVRPVNAETKLPAAKIAFLNQLKGNLDGEIEVALFGFTSQATLLHHARAGDHRGFDAAIRALSPTNGTDIAHALDTARGFAEESGDSRIRILLITDGKSDLEQARAAASRCDAARIAVDVILIDPTEEGLATARSITRITQGYMADPVTSAESLGQETDRAAQAHAMAMRQADEILRKADQEVESLSGERQEASRQEVSFSAGYPGRIAPAASYSLVVAVHLADLAPQIREELAQRVGPDEMPLTAAASATTAIERGTLLTVHPSIQNLLINPPRQEAVWQEETLFFTFSFRYAGPPGTSLICSGFVDVYASGLLVGQIPVSTAVDTKRLLPKRETVSVRLFSRVFASYAHKDQEDAAILRACQAAYKALGITLHIDRDDLLSGEPWRWALQQLIAKVDLFQLYWSRHSAASEEVMREWQLALDVGRARGAQIIHPLYWADPMPDPPEELRHLHFAFLDLRQLDLAAASDPAAEGPGVEVATRPYAVTFPVIALEEGVEPASLSDLQASMGAAVSFLEHLTGLRYFPPTTLIVDDYTVREVRRELTVDKEDAAAEEDLSWALDVLQALALAFHVRRLQPKGIYEEEEEKEFYGLDTVEELSTFKHVKRMCEWMFKGPVTSYFQGHDPLTQRGSMARDLLMHLDDIADNFRRRFMVAPQVKTILALLDEHDRAQALNLIGDSDPAALLDDDALPGERRERLAGVLRSVEFLSLIAKHDTVFLRWFQSPTRLSRSTSFATFISDLIDLWLGYTKTALERQNNPVIDIGFSILASSSRKFQERFPEVQVQADRTQHGRPDEEPGVTWRISLYDYEQAVTRLSELLLPALRSATPGRMVERYFVASVPTFGIFAGGRVPRVTKHIERQAANRGWPRGLGLAGAPKVLLCKNASDRYRGDLEERGVEPGKARELARWFLVSTLVHEHFHGILETGLDRLGDSPAVSVAPEEWERATPLNEALAAWFQRHFFRDNLEMFRILTDYIQAGDYPGWPYRGAETVEEIYRQRGMGAIRELVGRLRRDPESAQVTFDARHH